ncbi:RDD family protein [Streptomyces qinzhouensis]|uniref:RDD family protein n=1 Tax=Streptomyces qinzhouensis TaxID=2599401 RepID=A0A5B8JHM6_9ACTN|nr:RDD family protein [Streptomyces qinzhouensis]QDY77013.1 RDD family protein [Streptomyces qinzhouensis]
MSALVTGDAVVLGVQPAKLPSRALALAIDLVVVWGVFLVVMIGLTLTTASLDPAASRALGIASFLLIPVGAPIAVETLTKGRSLGKLACGLRVVRDDGGPIRFRHALVRGAMGAVEIMLTTGVVAAIASLVSARGRRIGDVFAGTLVVRERVPGTRVGQVPPPPPWLAGRFAQVDLSGVPDDLWLAVRQYLTRMGQLDPAVAWSMAARLADELVARTGTAAPEGVPPAAFLAAVVQERQARDARRAFGAGGGSGAGVVGDPGGAWGVPGAEAPAVAGGGAASHGWVLEPLPVVESGPFPRQGPRAGGGPGGEGGAGTRSTGFVAPG